MIIKGIVKQPFFENGFWWWWDPTRDDWFVGCAPSVGIPLWTKEKKIIDGMACVRTPSGNWAPDYSVPGVAERVKKDVDEAYDAQWSLDKWKR